MATTDESADAVRTYLLWLKDAEGVEASLLDTSAIAKLEKQIADETDPLEALLLNDQLLKTKTVSASALIQDNFMDHAQAWAKSKGGISREAWKALNVPDKMLRDAGLLSTGTKKSGTGGLTKTRTPFPDDALTAALEKQTDAFTKADMIAKLGLSDTQSQTLSNRLKRLVEEGTLVASADPNHSGKGRAANIYVKP